MLLDVLTLSIHETTIGVHLLCIRQGVRRVVKTTSRVRTTPKSTTRKIPAAKVPGKPATRIGEVTSQQLDIDPVTLTPFGTRL